MIPLIVVAGPTASGKTELALDLAETLGGEIISADSRQVYLGLDVGTAKPTRAQQDRVRHHLVDFLDVRESYSAGRFARDAAGVIGKLCQEGKVPVVCGGTGFYIEALLEPMFGEPEVPRQRRNDLRRELKERALQHGPAALHAELAGVDPSSAARLHPNDFQRVSRALELYLLTGRTMTALLAEQRKTSPYCAFRILLDLPVRDLNRRIGTRAARMLDQGWVEEVERVLARGVPGDAPGLQSLGYREVVSLVRGELDLDQALNEIVRLTRAYAKRQRTWFARKKWELELPPGRLDLDRITAEWRAFRKGLNDGP